MWITRSIVDDLRHSNTKLTTENALLIGQNSALNTTLDWFRVRITQLEHERAVLLRTYMGVIVPEVSIEREDPTPRLDSTNAVPHFHDMGDDEARKAGLDWDEQGNLVDSLAKVQ